MTLVAIRLALHKKSQLIQRVVFSLKGCPIVAGGRSADHRKVASIRPHPEKGAQDLWDPFRVRNPFRLLSGGLRYAATTGYYLTALSGLSIN
jgi:hypothetical protein